MIQTYNDILQEIQNFNEIFKDQVGQIQKIYSSSQYICIQTRFPGKNGYLFLGRGHGFEGFWLGEKQIDSFLRKRDRFLEYLRKYLSGSVLIGVKIDEKDRALAISYRRFGKLSHLMFFYCGRELYFCNVYLNEKKMQIEQFSSWKGTNEYQDNESVFEVFDDIGRKQIEDKDSKSSYFSIKKLLKKEYEKAIKSASSGKSIKFLKRKKGKILNDLDKVKQIDSLQLMVEEKHLDKLPFKNKIGSLKMNFKNSDHFKRRDEVYTKIKKLKKAKKILTLRLEDTQDQLSKLNNDTKLENKLRTIAPIWKTQKNKIDVTSSDHGYKVFDLGNISLAVGLTVNGNDALRKNWASKNDIWFHLDGDSSPHVVLKVKQEVLSQEVFQIVAACMKKFARLESKELSLVYTFIKNIKGVKGSAGKVIFKKEKRIKLYVEKDFNHFIDS